MMDYETFKAQKQEFKEMFNKRLDEKNIENLLTSITLASRLDEIAKRDQRVIFEIKNGLPRVELSASVATCAIAAVEILYASQEFDKALDYFVAFLEYRQLGAINERHAVKKFDTTEELEVFSQLFNSSPEMQEEIKNQLKD